MNAQNHAQMVNFIWNVCNLLRGPYKRNEYRKVILPLTILRRFDCILEPFKQQITPILNQWKDADESVILKQIQKNTRLSFYNSSRLTFRRLLDDPGLLAPNLNTYIHAFSSNVRSIFESLKFSDQVQRMNDKGLLYEVIKTFASAEIDLSRDNIDDLQMGYIFEELIRIGAEQSNEEAGEHFTPREVIRLMVSLLLAGETDLEKKGVAKTIYDPACGTGGMLSVANRYIRTLNPDASPVLHGQDWNDEAHAICAADMLIKGGDDAVIKRGCSFTEDGFKNKTFDYMLANPPFGVEWKQQQKFIENEHNSLGFDGRFGAGLPRINDGSLLFLQHMASKMRPPDEGGSRIAIVFNGSPLFTGDAGSGESEIRRWIIENDWLETIVALPDQLFYNTGISTYVWLLTNRKERRRRGKIQLIDARRFYVKMKKSLGNKRNLIGDGEEGRPDHVAEITRVYREFRDGAAYAFTEGGVSREYTVSKIFDNRHFGYRKLTVERPLRLGFRVTPEGVARLEQHKAFLRLTESKKKEAGARSADEAEGRRRQEAIRQLLAALAQKTGGAPSRDRKVFEGLIRTADRELGTGLSAPEAKMLLEVLGERDEGAETCRDAKGRPEPDPELRDTESAPLTEDPEAYFRRETAPHVPDAWIDAEKTKVGYEIPLNRLFYCYEPPRPPEAIEEELKALEKEIAEGLAEITGGGGREDDHASGV